LGLHEPEVTPGAIPDAAPVADNAPLVLVVEDDAAMRQMCCDLFTRRGLHSEGQGSQTEALARIRAGLSGTQPAVDLLVSDVRLGRDQSGLELLRQAKELVPELPVLLMTGYATVPDAVEAMKLGAVDYLTKPFERADLIAKVEEQLRHLPRAQAGGGIPGMLGESPAMRAIFEKVDAAARSPSTVLITGESGTGKELVARAIHARSVRKERAFIPVNCSALPEHLIESELFGHEAGAFTGAAKEGLGLFRAADGGTIFLDEVVDMPKDLQAKLLRVLQDRRVRPVGSTREYPIDVRVIAATNWDVERARQDGKLRDDLYFRLSVVRIHIPPLRERIADLALLLNHFLAKHGKHNDRRIRRVAPEALQVLARYPWPGNVRELESVVESGYAFGKSETLQVEDLPEWLSKSAAVLGLNPGLPQVPATAPAKSVSSGEPDPAAASAAPPQISASAKPTGALPPLALNDIEKDALVRALALAQGNKSKAAQLLGISRKRLYRMLHDYGLEVGT